MMDTGLSLMMAQPKARVTPPKPLATQEAIKAAAKEYEAVFLAQLLQPMFETIPKGGFFHGGHAEDVFQSMLTQEYGKLIADGGGIGLADAIAKELLMLQQER